MTIRAVGFLDVSALTARFTISYKDRLKDDPNYAGAQTILLRSAASDAAILKEWKSAGAALKRLRNAASSILGGKPAVLGKCMIMSLAPGANTDWRRDESEYGLSHFRLHVCLIPSPLAFVYSGGEGLNIPVGQVVLVDQQQLHSEINLGPVSCVHLIADIQRPDEG